MSIIKKSIAPHEIFSKLKQIASHNTKYMGKIIPFYVQRTKQRCIPIHTIHCTESRRKQNLILSIHLRQRIEQKRRRKTAKWLFLLTSLLAELRGLNKFSLNSVSSIMMSPLPFFDMTLLFVFSFPNS